MATNEAHTRYLSWAIALAILAGSLVFLTQYYRYSPPPGISRVTSGATHTSELGTIQEHEAIVWKRVPINQSAFSLELPEGWEVLGPEYFIGLMEVYDIVGSLNNESKHVPLSLYHSDKAPVWTRTTVDAALRSWNKDGLELSCAGYATALNTRIAVVGLQSDGSV